MKKWHVILFSLASLVLVITLTGCGNQKESEKQIPQNIKINISVSTDHGKKTIIKKDITTKAGTTLYEVMKGKFKLKDNGGFITSINNINQDVKKRKYWLFDINGKQSTKGAKDVHLKNGDKISWDLHEAK